MTNLLQQAINCDDADRAARIIRDALGIESDDVVNYCFPKSWPSSVRPSLVSGSKPKHVILLRERTPPLPTAVEELAEYFIVRDANRQALAYAIARMNRVAAQRRTSSPATKQGGLRMYRGSGRASTDRIAQVPLAQNGYARRSRPCGLPPCGRLGPSLASPPSEQRDGPLKVA